MLKTSLLKLLIITSTLFAACNKDNTGAVSIAPFSIENETTISLNGEIDKNTLNAFNEVLKRNPNTTLLIFKEAPGSNDDEVNLQVGRKLHQEGLNTHVEDNGFIASGAVDLFLAGIQRTLGSNTRVGVHSWSDGKNEATDFPRDSEEHQLFIKYYIDIGRSQKEAEDFYFFTIESATAENIHWMTEEELNLYAIATP